MYIRNGDLFNVDRLIKSGVDPSMDDNYAIQLAIARDELELVERLLQCKEIDPTVKNNFVIRSIICADFTIRWHYRGYRLEIAERLLMDKRVIKAGNFTPVIVETIKRKIIENTKIYVILKGKNFYNKTKIPDELIPLIMDFVCIKYRKY